MCLVSPNKKFIFSNLIFSTLFYLNLGVKCDPAICGAVMLGDFEVVKKNSKPFKVMIKIIGKLNYCYLDGNGI